VAATAAARENDVTAVAAKYILAVFAVVFIAAALVGLSRGGRISHPQTKTWLLVGVIFAVVSAWLFSRG
jgi:hypothetical protein